MCKLIIPRIFVSFLLLTIVKEKEKYIIMIKIVDNGGEKPDEKFFLLQWLHTSELSLHSSPTSLAAMFTASTRPANGTPRIKPRNKPRRPSLISFSLYEDDSTCSQPQTRVSRPFLRPLKRNWNTFRFAGNGRHLWYQPSIVDGNISHSIRNRNSL